ncbi:MAG: N-6 DNA methylase [Gemmatimonadetes bacterium]|nr:N-6 DNA methylase [Gemmatimonadota bacterium]
MTKAGLSTAQSVNSAIKSICDIMRRSNCAGAMQYVPELTWILFLRILDEREEQEEMMAKAVGQHYIPSLEAPYRWRDWAAPDGAKRVELQEGTLGGFFTFVNEDLLPHLKALRDKPNATARQKIISEVMSGVERVRIDTERNMLDVLDRVHEIKDESIDPTHVFPLSQVYEGLLLRMGEKGNDGGQFFTPREVVRALISTVDPKIGETVYDPACGTGGFLAQAYEHMHHNLGGDATPDQLDILKTQTFYGREKENLIYPIALANLVLHGIDQPHIWHGNTLTGNEVYGGLFLTAPPLFDIVLMNPPFGGKEGKDAQTQFAYKTGATQVLFLQHIIDSLTLGGRCGIVLDEGILFRTNEKAFVQTKRKLVEECNLWCIVSLPPGVFTSAGAGVKTNLLFFSKGEPTTEIWYYDLSDVKVTKTQPLTSKHFEDFFKRMPKREESEKSWKVDLPQLKKDALKESAPLRKQAESKSRQADVIKVQLMAMTKGTDDYKVLEMQEGELRRDARELTNRAQAIDDAVYDLKAVNPNSIIEEDTRTPEDLLNIIEQKGREVAEALSALRRL